MAGAAPSTVVIEYRRLPDRVQRFEQALVHRAPEYVVTFLPAARLERPVIAAGRTVLEPGSPVIWFTYPGEWFDIGRFHLADGRFTGIYANVLTPVEMEEHRWRTTDLCLDVWSGVDGRVELLDEEDLAEAVARGWVDEITAARARTEGAELLRRAREGSWPPAHVAEWTLDTVRRTLGYSSSSSR
jgi:predicted RNA-binding protein associated with RNAse of E/G family